MLRNSRRREVETALCCLTILIWVGVFIYALQPGGPFGADPIGVRFFFSVHYLLI